MKIGGGRKKRFKNKGRETRDSNTEKYDYDVLYT